ncbi:MAG: 5-(carboxyamino)imidazole ribonucleotide synthase [Acidimicrobiia bacterium]|nr:5-(carboxyamino)imidazole ribonucleotide synthase [Acidimicrobiia bacterium]
MTVTSLDTAAGNAGVPGRPGEPEPPGGTAGGPAGGTVGGAAGGTAVRSASRRAPSGTASAVVGVVGGGQLARMMHQAAIGLGVELVVLCDDAEAAAVRAGATHHRGLAQDPAAVHALAQRCDVLTVEHELVPNALLAELADAGHSVRPHAAALALAQDKLAARRSLGRAGFAVPAFAELSVGDVDGIERFATQHGWPVVLKAPSGGYDGRGVTVLRNRVDAVAAAGSFGSPCGRWLVEQHIDIATELAVLVARRPSGWWRAYPVVETVQDDGICTELLVPAQIPDELARRATSLAVSVVEGIDATGICAVELFVTTDGELVVNELALRPHNSGHATIDAVVTSQFENHLRAVLDWPLGDTSLCAPVAAMVNLLGADEPLDLAAVPQALDDPRVRVHLYGKAWRPGRKLGHVTAVGDAVDTARQAAHAAAAALGSR